MFDARPTIVLLLLLVVSTIYVIQIDTGSVTATGGPVSVAAGFSHTCVVLADGGVQCWGRNTNGELGDGTMSDNAVRVDVCVSGSGTGCSGGSRLTGVVDVTVGDVHSCALTSDGQSYCWGGNAAGQLGDGTTVNRPVAVEVCASGVGEGCGAGSALNDVIDISAGGKNTCVVVESGGVKCWGGNVDGTLGIGSSDSDLHLHPENVCIPFVPFIPLTATQAGLLSCVAVTGFASVDVGIGSACAVTMAGGAKCWGSNSERQLGNGSNVDVAWPVAVCVFPLFVEGDCSPISGVVNVSTYRHHVCALRDTGGVSCWGRNDDGQLGNGTSFHSSTPVTVCSSGSGLGCPALAGIVAIGAGSNHTCAIAEAGDVRCWGRNNFGQLGDGGQSSQSLAGPVSGLASGGVAVGAGSKHSCAAFLNGTLKCWGSNESGQLGLGSSDNQPHLLPGTVSGFDVKATDTPAPTAAQPTNTPPGAVDTPTPSNPTETPEPGATNTPTSLPAGLIGDVDCTGAVNAIDAALILQFAADLLGALPCPENADVNADGNTSAIDAALILQFAAGLLGSLPP